MVDRIVIIGDQRGGVEIDTISLQQMAGRAGRDENSSGIVDFIVSNERVEELQERLSKDMVVSSVFIDNIDFHLLSAINEGYNSIDKLEGWWKKSLYYFQNKVIPDFSIMMNELENYGMLEDGEITELGELTVKYYFEPKNVFRWIENFEFLFSIDKIEEALIAWALSSIPNQSVYIDNDYSEEYKSAIFMYGIGIEPESEVMGQIYYNILIGKSSGKHNEVSGRLKSDFGRLNNFLLGVNRIKKWGKNTFFEDLVTRIKYGAEIEVLWMCKLGIGRGMARYLYNDLGCETIRDLYDNLEFMDENVSKKIMNILNEWEENESDRVADKSSKNSNGRK